MSGTEDITSEIGSDYIELINLYKGFELELSLDEETRDIELLNCDKIKEKLAGSFIKMYSNKATAEIDSSQMVEIMRQLETTYSTPSLLISTYFPEIDLYFGWYPSSLEYNVVYDYEGLYPNPFGREAFPVEGRVMIDSISDGILKITDTSKIADEDVTRILINTLKRIAEKQNQYFDEEEIPIFTFDSTSTFHYSLSKKVVIRASSKKTNKTSEATQTQILKINL